ncbi:imidazolonepropionase-like domain-containing protein [Streptomyces sp. NPDC051555]|uniref:imidazolonepropionase-like domain-containing protein n=1 Tax=Streptomyces sp. NPDC051555 TaxID=3365657 RepID=UPI0037B7DBE9
MLTLHTADLLVTGPGAAALPGGAVLVEGDRIAAVGAYEALAERNPHARTRRWPGVLTPGLAVRGAEVLLERTYYPDDPYEIAELGADPITGAEALDALELTEVRWGNSARRATQKLLSRGVVAVSGRLRVPAVRTAVTRSGLALLPAPAGAAAPGSPAPGSPAPSPAPSLDPFAGRETAAAAFHGSLERGGPARFAAFDAADLDALLARGATTCVATVIGGRLLHRRR